MSRANGSPPTALMKLSKVIRNFENLGCDVRHTTVMPMRTFFLCPGLVIDQMAGIFEWRRDEEPGYLFKSETIEG